MSKLMSMTGFGAATFEVGGHAFRVEAKSVNHKGLSLRLHLPAELAHCEPVANTLARQKLLRGSVEVSVTRDGGGSAGQKVEVDKHALALLLRELQDVAHELGSAPPTLDTVLRLGSFVRFVEQRPDPVDSERSFTNGLTRAFDALVVMRQKEGVALVVDCEQRLASMERMLEQIGLEAPKVLAQMEERLRLKIVEQLAKHGVALEETRVLTEVIAFSDKSDITEELVRARAHIDAFRATLAEQSDATERGRRLDFLTQELLREWNTLGSKCRDAAIAQAVVDAKVELEKVREQVQNIA